MVNLTSPVTDKVKLELKPKSKIWLEVEGEVVFGGGRMALLQAIDQYGSIRQASIQLGMSYRAAWGKIKATEERLGLELVEKHAGGYKSGAVLTPAARELLNAYLNFKRDAVTKVDELFRLYFEKYITG